MRIRRAIVVVVAVAAGSLTPVAAAAANLAGDASFEQPVVSGAVTVAAGDDLGACGSRPDDRCWLVAGGPVLLVHDDFMDGGASWAPYAGHQLLELPADTLTAAGGARIVQSVQLTAGNLYKVVIWAAADPRAPLNARAALGVRMRLCDLTGTSCPLDHTAFASVWRSTADPAHLNWLKWAFPRLVAQADLPVLRVDLLAAHQLGSTAGILVDKFSVAVCPDPHC